ncbi:LysR family transcriptional regulator [Chitinimonas lacunae]|uniref:LysR family transcriptional regulator n=1 Tax=Chitinimonas lacunae TaxID=1963018 RepID=A0ABV8MRH2_9NEIS
MDRFTAMRVFVEVVQHGGFSAAAERLEMSRAMVTRYVAELEQWLGARLLQRTTRRVGLTDAGEQCLRRCQQILGLIEETEAEIVPADGMLRGQLRLTCSMSFGYGHLAAAVGDFLALHPQLRIDLDLSDRAVDLVAERVDLAVRISAGPDPALIGRPLAVCESVLVAAPAYLASHGTPHEPAELSLHRCLGYANFGRSEWRLCRDGLWQTVAVPTRFTANEATVLLQAVLAGAGIAIQPTYLANPLIAAGRLHAVLTDWRLPQMTVYALYPSRRHLSPAVRALLDFLVQRFAHAPWEP